jgi:radical SAM protein with 4Fe4S-binding SPASM domain
MAIDADGTVGACDTIPKGATRSIGHVLSGLKANFLDLTAQAATDYHPDCQSCAWLLACRGGCPGAAMSDSGSFQRRHQFACDQNLLVYPAILDLLSTSDKLVDYFRHHSKER